MRTAKSKTEPGPFGEIFSRLRAILERHAVRFVVSEDSPQHYCLEGGRHPTHGMPMALAWVKVGKAYVSFHHMGVYGCPKLLDRYSAALKKRMQGKSCFNFSTVDEALFGELAQLTEEAFAALRKFGGVS
jgi:hypothetical protein